MMMIEFTRETTLRRRPIAAPDLVRGVEPAMTLESRPTWRNGVAA
jgi:hypothetical protein